MATDWQLPAPTRKRREMNRPRERPTRFAKAATGRMEHSRPFARAKGQPSHSDVEDQGFPDTTDEQPRAPSMGTSIGAERSARVQAAAGGARGRPEGKAPSGVKRVDRTGAGAITMSTSIDSAAGGTDGMAA